MNDNVEIIDDIEHLSASASQQCSPEQVDSYLHNVNNGLKIFHVNIRSIGNIANFNNLLILLHRIKTQFDVVVLSECWLRKCPHLPTIPGFVSNYSDHSNQNDGVVVYTKVELQFLLEKPILADANCLVLKFKNVVALIAIYRSPSNRNIQHFITSLDMILNSLNTFRTIILVGDININIAPNWVDSNSDMYLNAVASHAMLPAHLFPTRNDSCIDHVMLKSNKPAITLVLDSLITDHAPVVVFCNLKLNIPKSPSRQRRVDINACVMALENVDFTPVMSCQDAETAASIMVKLVSSVVDNNSCDSVVSNRKRIIKPWITPGLLRCIRNRDNMYRKMRRDADNNTLKITYNRYKNFCNNLLKKLKREYERHEFEKHRKNPRATWNLIRTISDLQKNKASASELLSLTPDPTQSLEYVNDFFANVGSKLASKIFNSPNYNSTNTSDSGTLDVHPNSMAMFGTDNEEIDYLIRGLRLTSAAGWDGIPATVIYSARVTLVPVICHVFNLALISGIFPTVFKKAVVHPIHKGGDRDSVNNYRPISVLSILSKLLEKILNKRLLDYLSSQNILANNQYGFRSGKNTEDAILELVGSVAQNLNNKDKSIAIFLDLSKAFDTVSVPLLLSKLERIGIRGLPLSLFKSYLSGRSQIIRVNNHTSKEAFLTYGVPQGSVLGPTLFLVYINELCKLDLRNSKVIAYADDTVILVRGGDWREAQLRAESALRVTMRWLTQNLLTLNLDKTKFITFSPKKASQPAQPFRLTAHACDTMRTATCGCPEVIRTDSIKYLGVWVDGALTWSGQINSLVSRVRKLIFVFKNLRTSANFSTLRTVYFALAHSILTYCISAWGGAGKCLLLRLERAQRAVLKVMAFKPYRFPTSELYTLWKLPTVRHSFVLSTVLRKHSNLSFESEFGRQKRRTDRVCPTSRVKLDIVRRQFIFCSPVLYNKINKVLTIYPCTLRDCKIMMDQWLHTLTYEELENLVKP